MSISIRKLTPDLAQDYVRFFDETPHDENIPEHKCYCVCWCADDYEGKDFSTAEKRRELARAYIKNHFLQGYLAYCGETVVGWCNANTKAECYECISWKMFMQEIRRDERKINTDAKKRLL